LIKTNLKRTNICGHKPLGGGDIIKEDLASLKKEAFNLEMRDA